MSVGRRRVVAVQTGRDWKLSERKACRFLGFSRTSCRRRPREQRVEDAALIDAILLQVKSTPRLGCRKTLRMICRKRGWVVNHKRGARVWKQLRLNAQRARAVRKWAKGSSENACSVLRAMRTRQVFSWDFVFDATEGGSQLKWLSITDEYTHECLALEVEWSMDSAYVLEIIMRVVSKYGAPEFIRSDNGGEFIAQRLKTGLAEIGVEVKCIEPGAPWQNGYSESFHGQLRAELLDMEVFGSLAEAKRLGKEYRRFYNTERPHGSLKLLTPTEWAAQLGRPEPNLQPGVSRAHTNGSTAASSARAPCDTPGTKQVHSGVALLRHRNAARRLTHNPVSANVETQYPS